MANIIKSGAALLAALLKEYASELVTYERPGLGLVDVPATFGQKLLRTHDAFGGVRLEWTDLDFIIPAADIVIGGNQLEPRKGDCIYVTQGADSPVYQKYEVFPFGFEAPFRWSDPFLINYRIHTKFVAYAQPVQPTVRIYFGHSTAEFLDSAGVQGLENSRLASSQLGLYEFDSNQVAYNYICYPDTMGDVDAIVEVISGDPIATANQDDYPAYAYTTLSGFSYAKVLVVIDNDVFSAINYRVYRYKSQTVGGATVLLS